MYSVVYPLQAVEEDAPKEVREPLPVKKRLPGVLLLQRLAKQREKQKEKAKIDQNAVDIAVAGILADLER